ncbi:CIA30 family protein [Rutstroemia sp. NJR-2017a WRK4]|nr:CIA30 family protein [Rutstroemia sp. NJR-2017a WRK4]
MDRDGELSSLPLFGGTQPWSPDDWTSSDDRVRGGASQSFLDCSVSSSIATFRGTLDIQTLGGAGFASQRTSVDRTWDLSRFDGIQLDIQAIDEKTYTFIIKDELLPRSPNGREQSTISWEYDFKGPADHGKIFVRWDDLKPTYRGREKKDAEPLDLKNIKRFSIMMRSFFGTQEGDFSLSMHSISAAMDESVKKVDTRYRDDPDEKGHDEPSPWENREAPRTRQGWLAWIFGPCTVS